jgi:hypothetical protein
VDNLVALVLDELYFRDVPFYVSEILEKSNQSARSLLDVFGLLTKEVVEFLVAGYKLHDRTSEGAGRPILFETLGERKAFGG